MLSEKDIALYERLLARYLRFYEALRKRERRPKSAAQRQFQDVAWGKDKPTTDHEKAYVYYLTKAGILGPPKAQPPVDQDQIEEYPAGMRPVPNDVGRKWDERWIDPPGG